MKGYIGFIAGLLGFAGGMAAGIKVGKQKAAVKHEKEIESIRAFNKEHDKWLLKQYGIDIDKKNANSNVNKPQDKPITKATKSNEQVMAEMRDYNKITKPYNPSNGPKIDRTIYLITPEEFNESMNSFKTLHYFALDGVVADDHDNRINNFESVIGSITVWDKFVDKQPVYVRNAATGIDYEIVYREEKWSDVATPTQKTQAMNV